ncbi:unnamed protein product [Durusdinium trenchii]|uniref:CUE domain-containing protein n=1 Tax=Durusdinium trenchii TaxID=1381693 RepID=A0ABP0MUP9_9DINO
MGSQCSDCKCPNPNEPAVVQLGRALPSDYVAKVISDFAPSEGPVVEKVISEVLALDGSIDLEDPEELAVDLGSTDPANHSCHADGASVASRSPDLASDDVVVIVVVVVMAPIFRSSNITHH